MTDITVMMFNLSRLFSISLAQRPLSIPLKLPQQIPTAFLPASRAFSRRRRAFTEFS